MSKQSYSDLLKDPRWQRKRLEVMQRADFRCEACHDASTTLNVHHKYYVRGRLPWEYAGEALRCLCEPCHALEHGPSAPIPSSVRRAPSDGSAQDERIAAIDRALPLASDAQKNGLMVEKLALARELRDAGARRWKRFQP